MSRYCVRWFAATFEVIVLAQPRSQTIVAGVVSDVSRASPESIFGPGAMKDVDVEKRKDLFPAAIMATFAWPSLPSLPLS